METQTQNVRTNSLHYVYSAKYVLDIGSHVFPTSKYRMVYDALVQERLANTSNVMEPESIILQDLRIVHTPEYLDDLENLRYSRRTSISELPITREIVYGFALMASGTMTAARLACQYGIGFHIGGGLHHAHADHAEGFCYFNDLAYATQRGIQERLFSKAMIVDCDVHQGNGTAAIFAKNPAVFTVDLHQLHNYPTPKEKPCINVPLPDKIEDGAYLDALSSALDKAYQRFAPDIVLYQAGADPYRHDQLGGLSLTMEGLRQRDKLVISAARMRGKPVVITLGGGYARKVEDTVQIHVNTAQVANEVG